MISFGPVPSRRLGSSLGINNIKPKTCSYSCVYCQLGRTTTLTSKRVEFYDPDFLVEDVKKRIKITENAGVRIDFLTFVSDGEPTLDINLGKEINKLRETGYKVAVITNSSLLWMDDVRTDLMEADWVSLKIDTVAESIWRKMDRPYPSIDMNRMLESEIEFSREFRGTLTTETMLVKGLNDNPSDALKTARFISRIDPEIAYISIPTRPPAETWVTPPDESVVNEVYQIFSTTLRRVEYLTGFEGTDFSAGKDIKSGILGITAVHPMREDSLRDLLVSYGASWKLVEDLIHEGSLREVEYGGRKYYLRRFSV